MRSFIQQLIYWGIPSYRTTIFTPLPTGVTTEIQIAKQLPTQIGRIFGMSVYCDTVTPANQPLITTANATNLYLNLVHGATKFFEVTRLDDLNYNPAVATIAVQALEKWLPVNIPGDFDLSTSVYFNPTGIVSAVPPAAPTNIALNLWYISEAAYKTLVKKGMVLNNGLTPAETPKV